MRCAGALSFLGIVWERGESERKRERCIRGIRDIRDIRAIRAIRGIRGLGDGGGWWCIRAIRAIRDLRGLRDGGRLEGVGGAEMGASGGESR